MSACVLAEWYYESLGRDFKGSALFVYWCGRLFEDINTIDEDVGMTLSNALRIT